MKTILAFLLLILIAAFALLFRFDCPVCSGAGKLEGTKTIELACGLCKGKGKVKRESLQRDDITRIGAKSTGSPDCLRCRGTGKVKKDVPRGACGTCRGRGNMTLYQWFKAGRPGPR